MMLFFVLPYCQPLMIKIYKL